MHLQWYQRLILQVHALWSRAFAPNDVRSAARGELYAVKALRKSKLC